MKLRSALLVALMVASLGAPLSARADDGYCSTTIIIFSYPASLNSQALLCLAAEAELEELDIDPRLINPASTAISIRYTVDLGASVPTLTAVLDGLGFDTEEVVLERGEIALGLHAYDSDVIDLPDGAASSGCITASIPETEEQNRFHTIDASCS